MKFLAVMTLFLLGMHSVSANADFEQSGILSSLEFAVIEGTLSEVERSSCLMFPQITAFANATQGLHYKFASEDGCADDPDDYCPEINAKTDYRYSAVKIIDYYNAAGKVVTSKTVKVPQSIESSASKAKSGEWSYANYEVGYTPVDAVATELGKKLYAEATASTLLNIRRQIYEGAEVCSNSFYK